MSSAGVLADAGNVESSQWIGAALDGTVGCNAAFWIFACIGPRKPTVAPLVSTALHVVKLASCSAFDASLRDGSSGPRLAWDCLLASPKHEDL
jgi:hypothetical protein